MKMKPLLSICVPCYNQAKYFTALVEKLRPLSDIAEICVFDNGSTDGLGKIVKNCGQGIAIRYHRADPGGYIDYGWLGAIAMANSPYVKLQLGDDHPDAQTIREGLNRLIQSNDKDFILSKCSLDNSAGNSSNMAADEDYFREASQLRKKVGVLNSPKDRATFIFGELPFRNRLGDINGLIFRKETIGKISALSQNYYGFHTHPDSEIFLFLIANYSGMYFDEPFSTYSINSRSPVNVSRGNRDFALKVYKLPEAIHTLLLFIDPGFSALRRQAGRKLLWKTFIVYIWNLFHYVKESR